MWVKSIRDGVRLSLIAHARSQRGASDAAAYFVGLALDVLGLRINLPLYLNLLNPVFRSEPANTRRVVEEMEWVNAFDRGRVYAIDRPTYSRALSWYRKGLTGENPIDQLLSYWAVLESVASQFHERNKQTKKGTVNQICNCFDLLWGPVEDWKVIPNEASAVNRLNDYRSRIAHGGMRVDIETIGEINEELPLYQKLARKFLLDWETRGASVDLPKHTTSLFEPAE